MATDLRWVSLLVFTASVIRKSGQFFFDDLGGFRTFALTDIESHFEVFTIPCVSRASFGSPKHAALYGIFRDGHAGGLPWLRLLHRRLDIGVMLDRLLAGGLVSVAAWEFCVRAQVRLDTSFGSLASWGPCSSVEDMVANFQLRQLVLCGPRPMNQFVGFVGYMSTSSSGDGFKRIRMLRWPACARSTGADKVSQEDCAKT